MKNCWENSGLTPRALNVVFQEVSSAWKRSGRILQQSTNRKSLRGRVRSSSTLEPYSRCVSKIGYHIMLMRISTSFGRKIRLQSFSFTIILFSHESSWSCLSMPSSRKPFQGKGKGAYTWYIAPLRSESPPQKRSGMAHVLKGFQFYLHTHTFIRNQNEPYLPLPSQP